MNKELLKDILNQQKNEITEYKIYSKLSQISKDEKNKKLLKKIAKGEHSHYQFWKSVTKQETKPNKFKIFYYTTIAKFLGLSFGLKLMEKREEQAQEFYKKVENQFPHALKIKQEEEEHEKELIDILNDKRLEYAGAIVLGLNDALVELTGTLAGLTLAFQNSRIIGTTGVVMGLAASLSMASSGYLSSREEESDEKNPITSALYTGIAYILTVILLVFPYFIFENVYQSMLSMFIMAVLIILFYTFYISIAKDLKFKKRFFEMVFISLGVAIISFGFGFIVKSIFGIDV